MTAAAFETILKAADAPAPDGPARVASAARTAARRDMHAQHSNITPGHRLVFKALTSGLSDDFALMSVFVNEQPAAMIVAAREQHDQIEIMPLFLSITDGMRITDHDGDVIWEGAAS
jgi:hypothetical protein